MSEHMSWHRFYSAIYDDCPETVDQALYYLHTRALTTCLESTSTSLELAAKLDRTRILHTLLHSHAFQALDNFYDKKIIYKLVINAFLEGSRQGHLDVVKVMLSFSDEYWRAHEGYHIPDPIPGALKQAALAGAVPVIRHLFHTFPRHRSDQDLCRSMVSAAYWHGGHDISHLRINLEMDSAVEWIIESWPLVDFREPMARFNKEEDLHRPVLHEAAARVDIESLCEHRPDIWKHGRESNQARASKYVWKPEDFEGTMDIAAKHGKTDTCRAIIENGWVDTAMNVRWKLRLQSATENDRTETCLFLFQKFLKPPNGMSSETKDFKSEEAPKLGNPRRSARVANKKTNEKKAVQFPAETEEEYENEELSLLMTLLRLAVYNNNVALAEVLIDYASAYTGSDEEISKFFNTAVKMGLPRMALMFHSRGYKTTLCMARRTRTMLKWKPKLPPPLWPKTWKYGHHREDPLLMKVHHLWHSCNPGADCYHASLQDANVVITEILLGKGCDCWNTWTRVPILIKAIMKQSRTRETATSGDVDENCPVKTIIPARDVEILRLLLDKFKNDQTTDAAEGPGASTNILEHAGNQEWVYAKCFNAVLKSGSRVYNRHLLSTLYDFILVTPEMEQNTVPFVTMYPFDLTEIFHALCGSGLRQYTKKDILASFGRLTDVEHVQKLFEFASESGLVIRDKVRSLLDFARDQKWNLEPKPNSLQSHCRISIRRAIRAAQPVGSLEDKILSLSRDRILADDMVEYLVFRYDTIPTELRHSRVRADRLSDGVYF